MLAVIACMQPVTGGYTRRLGASSTRSKPSPR